MNSDFLVVGAGMAGASAGALLSEMGIRTAALAATRTSLQKTKRFFL